VRTFPVIAMILAWAPSCGPQDTSPESASDHLNSRPGGAEELRKEIEGIKAEKTALENEIREATDLEAWVLSSMPLQPLVVAIIQSMGPRSEIVGLTLERDAETPSQLRIGLDLNTDSDEQIEQMLEAIRGLNYREFNQTVQRVQGNLDYKAGLVRWGQDPAYNRQTTGMTVRQNARTIDVDAEQALAGEEALEKQLGVEKDLLADLQRQSADLLAFVAEWKPYFALTSEQQSAETAISMMVREQAMLTVSQRYEQVPHKIGFSDVDALPALVRATLVFDDNHSKLLNWIGQLEKTKPTMRIGRLALSKGSRGEDLRMELVLEVPLRKEEIGKKL
jgi:hypothetical protein